MADIVENCVLSPCLFAGEYLVFDCSIFVTELRVFSQNFGYAGKKCYGLVILNITLVTFLE